MPIPTGIVTFLFTDIEGSTRLWEQHPTAMKAALARHDSCLRRAIQDNHGYVFKTVGDAFCVAFDTAHDALNTALAAQHTLLQENWDEIGALKVRMAIHTGEAEERDGDYFGPSVNRVARILSAAHGGQILLSSATQKRVLLRLPPGIELRDLGHHRLKDLTQPEQIFQVIAPSLPADFPPLRSLAAFEHNLPVQLTSFIGREKEMTEVRRLLSPPPRDAATGEGLGIPARLVTLSGVGGTGKTRLALQVAADLLDTFADGIWLVELATVTDPALLPRVVASVIGVREEAGRSLSDTLIDYLRSRQTLLILDNCEHLILACAHFANALLNTCPYLRILATSREALGIPGEMIYSVPSLSLPDLKHLPPVEELAHYEAVHLFVDRAAAIQPAFALTSQNALAVTQICHWLDGIPLAIELAAARVRAMPVEQIAERVTDRFRLLTGGSRAALPRQQTLQALIDWSYDLLTEPERILFRRLAVFAGGWTLAAAEGVVPDQEQPAGAPQPPHAGAGGRQPGPGLFTILRRWILPGQEHAGETPPASHLTPADVLDLLLRLVDKSLVIVDKSNGETRYRFLETIRQYARDKLLAAGETESVRNRHLEFFVKWTEGIAPELWHADQKQWLDCLEIEHDNLRAALEWSQTCFDHVEAGLRLANTLGQFWLIRGYWSEGREWLTGLLHQTGSKVTPAIRGQALNLAGLLAVNQGDIATARTLLTESLSIGREHHDPLVTAYALYGLSSADIAEGNLLAAHSSLTESLALFQTSGNQPGMAQAQGNLGMIAMYQGNYATAKQFFEDCLNLCQTMGHKLGIAGAIDALAALAGYQQKDYGLARTLFEKSLAMFRELGDQPGMAEALGGLITTAWAQDDYAAMHTFTEERLTIGRKLGEKSGIARSLHYLARGAYYRGDYAAARAFQEESLAILREIGRQQDLGMGLYYLGMITYNQGDYAQAATLFRQGLTLAQETDTRSLIAFCLAGLGGVAAMQKKLERAARLLGASVSMFHSLSIQLNRASQADQDRFLATVRPHLDQTSIAAAWAEGQTMTITQAIAYAQNE